MSSIEERLERDIAAVTGGVVMTGADLQDAREVLEERIEMRRRNRRRYTGAAAAAVVLVGGGLAAYVAGSGDDPKSVGPAEQGKQETMSEVDRDFLVGDAPTVQALTGVWRLDNGVRSYQFSKDMTVRFHDSGRLFSDSASTGTYELDSATHRITVTTVESENVACVGSTTTFEAAVPKPGQVRLVVTDVSNGSPTCATVGFGQQVLEGLSPIQTFGPGWAAQLLAEKGWTPLAGTNLEGLFSDGEGRLLELDLDSAGRGNGAGRYYVVDTTGEVVDQGTWSADDALTLTSSGQSATCSAGDRVVLSGVEQHPDDRTDFRGTVTKNTCGGDWASAAWGLVPSLLHE